MKNFPLKISSFLIAVLILFAFTGCSPAKIPKIDTPEPVVGYDGVVVWEEVHYALYYIYVIDGGEQKLTAECSIQISENQSVQVKAVSADDGHADSDFSQPVRYVKNDISSDHTKSDVNGDGLCDVCGESVIAELSFYAVNDLHGKFMDTASQPGVDEFTTYIKDLYADNSREEILLSSGDMWQGTVESSTNKGQLITEWMNELGFCAMTLGNHEYDWGSQILTPNSELAEFPFLAINITYNGQAVDYCRPSIVVEKGGLKVGIIGAIGDCLSSISGDYTQGLNFATGSELTALVKNEAERLRNDENCDFIVYSIHDGYGSSSSAANIKTVTKDDISGYYDTALSDGYVDLVFEGHTHQYYILKDEYGVYHLQGGGENNYISCAELYFNTVTKHYTVNPEIISNGVYASSSIEGDPVVNSIFEKYFPADNPYTTVLGTNASRKADNEICEQVAKLYYEVGVESWGDSYQIVLGGGYLKTRSPYYIAAGSVTYADLFSVLPFDNDIVLGRIRGSYLKSRFLNTTNSTYHVYSSINAADVSDSLYYYIVVDSYSSNYTYNHITEVARLDGGKYARDLLADFVADGGWGLSANGKSKMPLCGMPLSAYTINNRWITQ